MGEWEDIPLVVSEGQSRSPFESSAHLDNLMLVPNPPGSGRKYMIANTPGLAGPISGIGTGAMRANAMVTSADGFSYQWYVQGKHILVIDPDFGPFDIGALTGMTTTVDACKIVPVSNDHAVIVCAGDGKAWLVAANIGAQTGTVTAITLPAGTIQDVTWIDGYTVYARQLSDEWYISALDDPTTINALDFTNIDAEADQCRGVCVVSRELIVFGNTHLEFYYDSGNALFPFTRQQPGTAKPGTLFPASLAVMSDMVFYMGSDFRIYMIRGYTAQPISDEWIEALIALPGSGGFTNQFLSVWGSAYVEKGRRLYSLSIASLPSGLLVYDIDAGVWHTRSQKQGGATAVTTHAGIVTDRGVAYMAANRPSSNDIYVYDVTVFRDGANTTDTLRTMVLPAVEGAGKPIFESDVRLDIEKTTGVAGTAQFDYFDESATASITLGAASAQTDGNANTSLSTNQDLVAWHRCGRYRRRRHKFRILANARVAINAVQHKYEVGI